MTTKRSKPELAAELEHLRTRLSETEEVLRAIRDGDVDAVVVSGGRGERVYTLSGADRAYRQLIETMSEGAATLSADGVILYCNLRLAEMLGRPLDQVMGSALRDYLSTPDQQALDAILAHARTAPARREFHLKASEGCLLPVYLSASRLQSDGAEMVFCLVLTDLTEHKSQERIAAEQRLGRLVLEQAAEAIVVCDEQGRVIRASRSAERFCDGSPLLRHFAEAFPLRTDASDGFQLAAVWQGETLRNVDLTLDRQGQTFNLILNAGLLLGGQQILGCVVSLTDITERKQAEDALVESERKLKAIFDAAADGILLTEAETGRFRSANSSICRMLGYSQEEMLNLGVSDIHPKEELSRIFDEIERLAKTDIATAADLPMKRKNGSVFFADIRSAPTTLGGKDFLVGTFRDATERRRAQEALRDSEDRYRDLVENNRDLICTHDLDGKLLSVNMAAVRITGYPREALLRMNMADLIVPAARDGFAAYLAEIRTAGKAHGLMRICTAGGEKRWWEYDNTLRTKGVAVPVVRGLAQDVTERLQAERDLADSEVRFRGLVEQSIAGIYVIQDGKLVYVNPRFAEIFGYGSAEEVIGRDALSLVAEKDRETNAENMRQRIEGEVANVSYQFTGLRKDGSSIEIGVHGARATQDGRPAIIGLMQDISEKTRLDKEIQRYVEELKTAFMSSVEVATVISEMRDPYTAGHERRVAQIAVAIGAELGFNAHRQEGLQVAGHLHDIGKITIPAEILSKPSKLSAIEFRLIQGHPQASHDVLKGVTFPWPVAEIALQHHERMDGSGYPQGLKGEAILLEARIMAVADVVEAMSSHRPYRPGLGIDKALAEIERGRGTVYDPVVADACPKLFREQGYAIPG